MPVIFVCGVHGVGKTTFCQKLSKRLNIPYFTASALIREKSAQVISDKAGDKRVKNIENNQILLVEAVHSKLSIYDKIILDGHATIIDQDGNCQSLPEDVFQKLGIASILLVKNSVSEIARRLLLRDGISPDPEFIRSHQNSEMQQAMLLADRLKIRFYALDGSEEALRKIVEDRSI